jgi:hypothetical protein
MENVLGLLKGVFRYKKEVILNILSNSVYVFFSLFSFILIIPFISVLFGVITPPAQCPEFALNKDVIMDYVRGIFIYVRCNFKEDYYAIMELCFGKF